MWRRSPPVAATTTNQASSSGSHAISTPYLPYIIKQDEETAEEETALSISDQRTLYLVNIFIGNTSKFLNSFASVCEKKLIGIHRRIVRMDSMLMVLEAKLRGAQTGSVNTALSSASSSTVPPPGPLQEIVPMQTETTGEKIYE